MNYLKLLKQIIFTTLLILLGSCSHLKQEGSETMVDERQFSVLIEEGIKYLDSYDSGDRSALVRAKSCFSIAKDIKPSSPLPYDGLGSVSFRESDYALARFLFEKSVELDGSYGRAKANLAAVHYREGRFEMAEALLRRAVKLNALDHRAVNNLGSLLYNTSKDNDIRKDEGKLNFYKARELAKEKTNIIEDNIKSISQPR